VDETAPYEGVGGVVVFITSSNIVVSARKYISVVCVLAWPSHKATLRMSPVDCRIIIAHECRLCRWRHRRYYVSFLTMLGTLGFALCFPANSPVTGHIVLAPSLSPA
jgi:hypothetical protein